MKQKIYMILSCVSLTCLFSWGLWNVFHIHLNKLCSESSGAFAEAMQKEKTLRIGQKFGNYDPMNSPNKISGTEKEEWCDQDFLFYKDSTRTLLDSLFRATLLEQNIQSNTALRCIWEGRIIKTSSNDTFYEEALPLEQFVYRIDENPNRTIMLQAYIKLPFWTVWRHSYLMWGILALGLLLLGSVIGGYRSWCKKMRKIAEQELQQQQHELKRQELLQKQEELQEKEKQLPTPEPLIPTKTICWVELAKDLIFNKEHGDLCYKNEVNIRLVENSLRLFCLFVQVEEYKLTYEKICIEVLARSTKDGLSKTDRDAVANAIRHLRKHLEQIPVIRIETIRGLGYQMIISAPALDEELH